nr:multicopper oxidase domain-containing protein [Nitrosopumilaceae archaeon]NIU01648.1 multicopper oxidase domain-containing protein [Nitrosopumilaceae archaeon]NIU88063.1 multicopper oxidase domain-containing protein [Nitrosopumilaceae archaeon]NIV66320.1 multicopper oxidase domain-containing protein [Nitrosopumilaceae archaeon]NIX62250.1 multicopper oxidase domain-containing protein [Nitrosopumilaceae archaeon]
GHTPGPFMIVNQGDQITIKFTNNLDFPTTVHWHGLRLDYTSDGVPKITQDPIPPEGVFEYKLKFPDEGIFVYHPHVRTEMQVDLGLYGNILVESDESQKIKPDYKVPLILDDIPITADGIQEYDSELVTHTLMGRFGNVMLVNGNPNYSLDVKENDIVRFYLTNTANTRVFNFTIEQQDIKLVSSDVSSYEKESFVKSVILAPFERKIVDVLFDSQGTYKIIHATPDKKYILGEILVKQSNKKPDVDFYNISNNEELIQDIGKYKKYFLDKPDLELEFDLNTKGLLHMDSMQGSDEMSMMEQHEKPLIEWEDEMPKMNAMSNEENTRWILRDTETGKEGFDINYQAKVGD